MALADAKRLFISYGNHSGKVSIELEDAPPGPNANSRVIGWLVNHRATLAGEERRFKIDRRAIAGAIAYEGLKDVAPMYVEIFSHWSGPGKVHFREFLSHEGDPVAKQVEDMGLLPKLSMERRESLLSTPVGAITYVAAIMHAFSLKMAPHGENLNCNVPALITLYMIGDLRHPPSADALERQIQRNPAADWAVSNLDNITQNIDSPPNQICTGSAN